MQTDQNKIDEIIEYHLEGKASRRIGKLLGIGKSTVNNILTKWRDGNNSYSKDSTKLKSHLPKVLVFDLETAPIRAAVWGLWKQNIGLNMIEDDWFLLSYAAKWLGAPAEQIQYGDLRGIVDQEDDTSLLDEMWVLLDEADIVITQNGKKFDVKKINARFILNGYQPPSSYKHIDTLEIAKRAFGFTSNKLEYMTDNLCENKKLKHTKFPGFDLWSGMLDDNPEAWAECEAYNKMDVLSLEELYLIMAPWDTKHPNFNLYTDEAKVVCRCGSTSFNKYGFAYTSVSKFQRYRCTKCGAESRGRKNLFSKEKRESLQMNITN